jgi:hypothetical protein
MTLGLTGAAGRQTARSCEESDAMRSALTGLETVRQDVARMIFQEPRDMAILEDGRRLSLLVPGDLTQDRWTAQAKAVTFRLVPVAPGQRAFWLSREEEAAPSQPLRSCLLADVVFRHVPAGQVSELQDYLEVIIIGLGRTGGGQTYTATALLPLSRITLPLPDPLFTSR